MDLHCSQVNHILEMGKGARVELDFVDVLGELEGVLVGDSARGFFCVLAETRATETYPPRPFRVNAGAIHQYVYVGDNKTKYLSEIKAGDQILVSDGKAERFVAVGRVKIEPREFEQICLDSGITATLQKADSVYVLGKEGPIHLMDLKAGDMVATFPMQDIARHKGVPIEESIIEK